MRKLGSPRHGFGAGGWKYRIEILLLLFASTLSALLPLAGQEPDPSRPATPTAEESETPPPGDWAPQLLDAILSSPNAEAHDALHRAAFGAGPAIVPQLVRALEDDRTAEFAAQSLAFIGGEKALEVLSKLVDDQRDLDLRRFFYGALGEFQTPQATQVLLDVVERSDAEPDRTVIEAAILALTLRSDASLVPRLRETEKKIKDLVIRDDLDNALEVIEARAKYLASPDAKSASASVERAVRTYFIPALEPPPTTPALPPPRTARRGAAPAKSIAQRPEPTKPPVNVEIQNLTLSPDKTRALARVVFEDPSAMAYYDIVLQKRFGEWTVASVWLGSEFEKPQATPTRKSPQED